MKHGTYSRYVHGPCRCEPCTEAATAYKRHWVKAASARPIPDHVHGTWGGYVNYRCRCTPCRDAAREGQRGSNARRAARDGAR